MRLQGEGGAIRIETRSDRIVMVECCGLVTRSAMVAALDMAWAARRPGRDADYYAGMVVDLRKATYIDKDPRDCPPAFPLALREMPGAAVVQPHQRQKFLSCAMVCATIGILLRVFTAPALAQSWVASRAKALRAQRAMLQRKSPVPPLRRLVAEFRDPGSDPANGQDPEQEGRT